MDIKGIKPPLKFKYSSSNSKKIPHDDVDTREVKSQKLDVDEQTNSKQKGPRNSEISMDTQKQDQNTTFVDEDVPDIDLDDPINFESRTDIRHSSCSVVDEDDLRCVSRAAQELVYSRIPTSTSDTDSGIHLNSTLASDEPTSLPELMTSPQDT